MGITAAREGAAEVDPQIVLRSDLTWSRVAVTSMSWRSRSSDWVALVRRERRRSRRSARERA